MKISGWDLRDQAQSLWLLLLLLPLCVYAGPVLVGDIEIDSDDFSGRLSPEERIAKCLSCHGENAGGDVDFGLDVQFGTPALRGMSESYLKESLAAYKTGTRFHEEMTVISEMLDGETMDFMARSFAAFDAPPTRSASDLASMAERDAVFRKGQSIAREGVPENGIPACASCHGDLGEGRAVGPRLAGQNVKYFENQFEAFASGTRRTPQSAVMKPVVTGMSGEDLRAVAHYYESLQTRGR